MGPLFSAGLMVVVASVVFAGTFVVARIFGLSLRSAVFVSTAFLLGAVLGGAGALILLGLLLTDELQSSLAVASFLGTLACSAGVGGVLAVFAARRAKHESRVPSA